MTEDTQAQTVEDNGFLSRFNKRTMIGCSAAALITAFGAGTAFYMAKGGNGVNAQEVNPAKTQPAQPVQPAQPAEQPAEPEEQPEQPVKRNEDRLAYNLGVEARKIDNDNEYETSALLGYDFNNKTTGVLRVAGVHDSGDEDRHSLSTALQYNSKLGEDSWKVHAGYTLGNDDGDSYGALLLGGEYKWTIDEINSILTRAEYLKTNNSELEQEISQINSTYHRKMDEGVVGIGAFCELNNNDNNDLKELGARLEYRKDKLSFFGEASQVNPDHGSKYGRYMLGFSFGGRAPIERDNWDAPNASWIDDLVDDYDSRNPHGIGGGQQGGNETK